MQQASPRSYRITLSDGKSINFYTEKPFGAEELTKTPQKDIKLNLVEPVKGQANVVEVDGKTYFQYKKGADLYESKIEVIVNDKVVGELAPSTITFALMFDALVDVMTPPTAAGINTSHSSSNISPTKGSPPEKPFTVFSFAICLNNSGIFSPFSLYTPPVKSLTASTLAPLSYEAKAAYLPTFPKP